MSVHSSQQPEAQHRLAPADAFERVIQDARGICSRCFRRKMVAVPLVTPVDERGEGNVEVSTSFETILDDDGPVPLVAELRYERHPDVDVCYPPPAGDDEMPAADRQACPRPRTVCECGAIDHDATRATLSVAEAVACAERISDRLAEEGIDHDRADLLATVEERKRDPETAGRDEETFAVAVEAAMTDAQTYQTDRDRLLAQAD